MSSYAFPIYTTDYGGKMKRVGSSFIFLEKPNFPGFEVDDVMPEDWQVFPANKLAEDDINERFVDPGTLTDNDIVFIED